MLTQKELKELKGLHDQIFHFECFGIKDLAQENYLWKKATERQLYLVCDQDECQEAVS